MRKALAKFAKHEASDTHSEAVLKIQSSATVDISQILNATVKKQQLLRQRMLLKQLSTLRYLAHQGLAIRGHAENEGNILQLMKVRCADDPEIDIWLREGKYLSPDILNEMIALMANPLLREILFEIRSAKFYAVLADETADVSNNEQMCITIRWVDEEYTIFEEPIIIGLVQLPKTDANTLTLTLKDVLL